MNAVVLEGSPNGRGFLNTQIFFQLLRGFSVNS